MFSAGLTHYRALKLVLSEVSEVVSAFPADATTSLPYISLHATSRLASQHHFVRDLLLVLKNGVLGLIYAVAIVGLIISHFDLPYRCGWLQESEVAYPPGEPLLHEEERQRAYVLASPREQPLRDEGTDEEQQAPRSEVFEERADTESVVDSPDVPWTTFTPNGRSAETTLGTPQV